MSLLTCDKLFFKYRRNTPSVLKDITLNLESGRIYGLLGKNGVGKSTLFRVITGLNPVTSGTILTMGMNPRLRQPSLLGEIYLLPEEMEFPNSTITEYGELMAGFYPNFSMDDMLNYMDSFFLPMDANPEDKEQLRNRHYLKQPLRSMSQGQRKKACISIALACHTKILLMDEPTNGLDIPSKTVFRRMLSDYRSPENLVIISTHQVRDLEQLIDGVIIIDEEHTLSLCETSDRLLDAFHFGSISPDDEIIYQEEGLRGQTYGMSIRTVSMDRQTIADLDLELIFNACMVANAKVHEILNSH